MVNDHWSWSWSWKCQEVSRITLHLDILHCIDSLIKARYRAARAAKNWLTLLCSQSKINKTSPSHNFLASNHFHTDLLTTSKLSVVAKHCLKCANSQILKHIDKIVIKLILFVIGL